MPAKDMMPDTLPCLCVCVCVCARAFSVFTKAGLAGTGYRP